MAGQENEIIEEVSHDDLLIPPIRLKELHFNNGLNLYNHLTKSDILSEWKYSVSRRLLKYQIPMIKGEDVKCIQESLITLGYNVGPAGADGIFGENTEKAVQEFQKYNGLTVDGIVGPETRIFLGLQGAAAYTLDTKFTVKAKFIAPKWIESAEIWASECADGFDGLGSVGDPSKPVLVKFTHGRSDNFYTFQIKRPDVNVSLHKTKWLWKCKNINGSHSRKKNIGYSDHIIYTLMSRPQPPMEKPWIAVLHKACEWAKDVNTPEDVAKKVTEKVNESPFFEYDTVQGAANYLEYASGNTLFNCSKYLERLNGGLGKGKLVNCTDCASIVTTFANALGGMLYESRMGYRFACNEIIPIGFSNWQVPFGWGFAYHEVAWTDACSDSNPVFDACLKLDGDDDPASQPHSELLPTNIIFHVDNQMLYKERLAANNSDGRPKCNPQPKTKIIRSVV